MGYQFFKNTFYKNRAKKEDEIRIFFNKFAKH